MLLLLLSCATPESATPVEEEGCLQVTPALHFGVVEVDTVEILEITIHNPCDGQVVVKEIEVEGDAFEIGVVTSTGLPPGVSTNLPVFFRPTEEGADFGALRVFADDREEARPIALTGTGAVPVIGGLPDGGDLGEVLLGCHRDVELTMENRGQGILEITDIQLNTGVPDFWFHSLPDLPIRLESGEIELATLRYEPQDEIEDVAYIVVESNDPETPLDLVGIAATGLAGEGADEVQTAEQDQQQFTLRQVAVPRTVVSYRNGEEVDSETDPAGLTVTLAEPADAEDELYFAYVLVPDECL